MTIARHHRRPRRAQESDPRANRRRIGRPARADGGKSRFAEIFRAAARTKGDGRTPTPPCKTVLKQFERLEQFRG
jgi:hypothetical protein